MSTHDFAPVAWPKRMTPLRVVRAFVAAHPDFDGRVWVWSLSRRRGSARDLARGIAYRVRERWHLFRVNGSVSKERSGSPRPGDLIIDLTHDEPRLGRFHTVTCRRCGGAGRDGEWSCFWCDGTGFVVRPQWLDQA